MPSKFNKILDKVWKILIRFVKSSKKFHQKNYLRAGQQQAKKLLLPPSKDQFLYFVMMKILIWILGCLKMRQYSNN